MSENGRQARVVCNPRSHRLLAAILAGFVLLGVVYCWSVPPFEGPDEAQHFAYIEWLAEGKGFPPQDDAAWNTAIKQEAGQPPLYYVLASIPARWAGVTNPRAAYRPNPHFVGPYPRTTFDNDNRAIHYPWDARPLRGGWLGLYLARGVSLSFGVMLIIAVYGLARQVVPTEPHVSLGAAFLVAFAPQVLYISSLVSNDIPAAALGTLVLWLLAVLLRERTTRWWALAVGATFGLAVLTKISALGLAAPLAAGLGWLWLSRRRTFRQVILIGGWIALGTSLVAGWWLIRSWIMYGSPLGLEAHHQTAWAIAGPSQKGLASPLTRWKEVGRTYWLALGWGTIRADEWVYSFLRVLMLVALGGVVLAAWRWARQPHSRPKARLALLGILLLHLLVTAALLEVWMHRVIAPWGRLLFPAASAISILLVIGWRAIHPKLSILGCGFVASWALLAPILLIWPAYKLPLLTAEEIAQLPPSIGLRYGRSDGNAFAELISVEPLERSTKAGTVLPVRICWRALAAADRDYTVLVHIVGPNDRLVANRRTYPGLGRYPTTTLRADDTFCDLVHVAIPKELAETLVYKVEIALLDEQLNERLSAFDREGNLLSHTFVDQVRLIALGSASSFATNPGSKAVQLIDYDAPTIWKPGCTCDLTLHWGAFAPLPKDYQVFMHLRDPKTNQIVAQADGPPLDGWYPTSWWPVGEAIVDERSFTLPTDVPLGKYDLVVGLYDLVSGERPWGEHFLGTIEVVEQQP